MYKTKMSLYEYEIKCIWILLLKCNSISLCISFIEVLETRNVYPETLLYLKHLVRQRSCFFKETFTFAEMYISFGTDVYLFRL